MLLGTGCTDDPRNPTHKEVSLQSIARGKVLAQQYCASCHALPDPAQLDSRSWEKGVLPNMGPRLGIFYYGEDRYPSAKNDPNVGPDYYPRQPVLSFTEWQHIIDYFTATSPDSLLPAAIPGTVKTGLPHFVVEKAASSGAPPSVVYLGVDTAAGRRNILLAEYSTWKLHRFRGTERLDSVQAPGPVLQVIPEGEGLLALNVGEMNPTNGRWGKVQRLSLGTGKPHYDTAALLAGLARPVELLSADLDGDGRQDYVVGEFGFITGALTWHRNLGDGRFERRVLRGQPGAVKAYLRDPEGDGQPDLWVLFAQGDEGIYRFRNRGEGRFEEERVLRFPAVWGSTYFELTDLNGDGREDVVYTAGDNADYSPVLKPYHGIYLYLNEGGDRFRQAFFYPLNGCFKALARDFDRDGDPDLAAIAYFADFRKPSDEGFVYLQNLGNFKFQPYRIPESKTGRWLTMDAGDADGDGWTDIVIGNFSGGPQLMPPTADWKKGPLFLLLRNKAGAHQNPKP